MEQGGYRIMIREHTIQCDECSAIAPLKDSNFKKFFGDDICRECVDKVLSRLDKGDEQMKLTNEMVERWLGTSNPLSEAIDIIKEIANGDYSLESLNQDITEYYEGEDNE